MNTKLVLVALLLTTTALSACAQKAAGCRSTGPTDFKGQSLTVLDQGAWNLAYAYVKPIFENQTGAKLVQLKGEDAGSALRQAADSKGNPVADVLYGIDNLLLHEAARDGILEPYASPRLSAIDPSVVKLDDFRQRGTLLATPVDHGYISVNYDVRLTKTTDAANLPKTLQDLAKPEWASKLAVEDPRRSTPGLGFLATTVANFGESGAYDYLHYWRDLFKNGVFVAPDWTNAYEVHFTGGYGQGSAGFVGDRPLVVSYTTSPAVEAYYGSHVAPSVSLEPPRGVFHQIETAAILKCTKELPLAKAFVDLLLGKAYQDNASATMAVYPVIRGGEVIPDFTTNATDPHNLVPAPFTSDELDRGVPRWVDAWTKVYEETHA